MRPLILKVIITFALFSVTTGCMTMPTAPEPEGDFHSLFPPLKSGKGRIYFFRNDIWAGSLITPPVSINGVFAGSSVPGEFFYVDVNKGNYRIQISEGQSLELTLKKGEEKFIKMELGGTGIFYEIIPKLANPHIARREIMEMHTMKKRGRKGNFYPN